MTPRALLTSAGLIAGLTILGLASPAGAADLPTVPLNERVPAKGRTTPGSVHELASSTVDPANVGSTCDLVVTGANNESVHPNNDILVTSANTVTIADVEREANVGNIPADGQLTLGATVTISVRLGADGLFSGGTLEVGFACTPPPPPPPPPTTTPPAPPAAPPTTVVKLGPPTPPQTKPCDNPEAPQTETTADDCALPKTGSSSAPLAGIAAAALAAGAAALAGTRTRRTA